MTSAAEMRAAIAAEQIGDLLSLWCEAFNAGDAALMGSLFIADGEMEIGAVKGQARTIAAGLASAAAGWAASTANDCITVTGEEAQVESYIFLTGTTGSELQRHHAGRALDRLVVGLDGWRFASRRIVVDWRLDDLEHTA